MIQSLFTGKDISLRKEEKCASLSQAAALLSGMFGKNVWGGRKQAVIISWEGRKISESAIRRSEKPR